MKKIIFGSAILLACIGSFAFKPTKTFTAFGSSSVDGCISGQVDNACGTGTNTTCTFSYKNSLGNTETITAHQTNCTGAILQKP